MNENLVKKKKVGRKPLSEISRKTKKNGKESGRGTVKKCALIRRRRMRFRNKELNTSKKKGDPQFTDDGRKAEITVDLALHARAKMSEDKENGPEDAVARDDQAVVSR